jgi:hypothetical protein
LLLDLEGLVDMDKWLVSILLKDGTSVCELTVDAESRVHALVEAVYQARRNDLDANAIYYASVDLADESKRIFTGGSAYVELLPLQVRPDSVAHP